MHFLYYLVNPNLQHYSATSAGSEAVYFTILEDYLNYFLPYSGIEPDTVPFPSQTSPFGSPIYSPSPKPRYVSYLTLCKVLNVCCLQARNTYPPEYSITLKESNSYSEQCASLECIVHGEIVSN